VRAHSLARCAAGRASSNSALSGRSGRASCARRPPPGGAPGPSPIALESSRCTVTHSPRKSGLRVRGSSIEARALVLDETETARSGPLGTSQRLRAAGCPPEADVHAPRGQGQERGRFRGRYRSVPKPSTAQALLPTPPRRRRVEHRAQSQRPDSPVTGPHSARVSRSCNVRRKYLHFRGGCPLLRPPYRGQLITERWSGRAHIVR